MTLARLPLEELKLVAWHHLLENDSIECYEVETRSAVEITRYYDRFGNPLSFKNIQKVLNQAAKAFDSLGKSFESLGVSVAAFSAVFQDMPWASPLDSYTEGGDHGDRSKD